MEDVLFNQYIFPWLASKYAKRISRLFYMYFIDMLTQKNMQLNQIISMLNNIKDSINIMRIPSSASTYVMTNMFIGGIIHNTFKHLQKYNSDNTAFDMLLFNNHINVLIMWIDHIIEIFIFMNSPKKTPNLSINYVNFKMPGGAYHQYVTNKNNFLLINVKQENVTSAPLSNKKKAILTEIISE